MIFQEVEQQAVLVEPFFVGSEDGFWFRFSQPNHWIGKKIEQADVIITGEGRIDQQTIHGKVPHGVAVLAKKYRKPIIAICGSRDQELEGLSDFLPIVLSIHLGPIGLEEAMEHRQTLEKTKILGQTLSRFFTILPK